MLKSLFKSLLVFFFSIPVIVLILAISDQPIAARSDSSALSESQIANIQQLLIDHDPRLLINSDDQVIRLNEKEVNDLLTYFKSSLSDRLSLSYSGGLTLENTHFNAQLLSEALNLDISTPIPLLTSAKGRSYLNYSLLLVEDENSIQVGSLKIGDLTLPSVMFQPLATFAQSSLQKGNNYRLFNTLYQSISDATLSQGNIALTLNWQAENLVNIREQARQLFINVEEAERLKKYQNTLFEIVSSFPQNVNSISLNSLFKPMFASANINSNNGANPVAENRAVFTILTTYLTELRLEHLIGENLTQLEAQIPRRLRVTVGSRQDLAQHIVGSAAIASAAGASVASILSIYKEVHDSRYRSGFSFSDLTANEVGTLLGSYASQDRSQALRLQSLLANSTSEVEFMPTVGRVDGLSEEEFLNIYQSRNSEKFLQRLDEIQEEISLLPLFQKLNL